MRKVIEITLQYTKEELAVILQNAISLAEKVSIKNAKFEDGKFIFHCVDGINVLPQGEQVNKLASLDFTGTQKTKSRKVGLKKALKECLAGGVKCSIEKLVEELKLKGFDLTKSYLRTTMVTQKDTYKEVDLNIFQLV